MSHDPEQPTRGIRPRRSERITTAEPVDEVAFREDVLDHLRSLRTGLALVAVLAAAALGIAGLRPGRRARAAARRRYALVVGR